MPSATTVISRPGVIAVAVVVLCLILVWAVVGETVADAIAHDSPKAALTWRPAYAGALQGVAEEATENAVTSSEIALAEKAAQTSLKEAPMSAAALNAVAVANQLKGDAARTLSLMNLAGRRNQRDRATNLWLFNENLRVGRYPEAFLRADLILRRHPDDRTTIYQTLASVLDRPGAMAALLETLKQGPDWRQDFLRTLNDQGDPGGLGLKIIMALRASSHPPMANEVQPLVTGLTNQGQFQQAHQVWLTMNQTDPNATAIFDGGFELPRRVPPFDWRFVQSAGVSASVEPIEGAAGHALYAEYPTGAQAVLAEQMLVLAPGSYRFSGRAKIDRAPGDAAMKWTISCAPAGAPIATAPQAGGASWRGFTTDVQIPSQGCPAQWLRLVGMIGSTFSVASGWFDDLRLAPAGAPSAAADRMAVAAPK